MAWRWSPSGCDAAWKVAAGRHDDAIEVASWCELDALVNCNPRQHWNNCIRHGRTTLEAGIARRQPGNPIQGTEHEQPPTAQEQPACMGITTREVSSNEPCDHVPCSGNQPTWTESRLQPTRSGMATCWRHIRIAACAGHVDPIAGMPPGESRIGNRGWACAQPSVDSTPRELLALQSCF